MEMGFIINQMYSRSYLRNNIKMDVPNSHAYHDPVTLDTITSTVDAI